MKRSLPIVLLALLSPSSHTYLQAQSTATIDLPPAPPPQTPPSKSPVAAVSFGYLYIASETPNGTWDFHLHGFYGIPQVNIKPWFGLIGDFTSSYNTGAGQHENLHSFLGGPIFTARSKSRISPFAFVDAGKVRDSKSGTITSDPILASGGGVTVKLSKRVGLLFVPGEYIRTYAPAGSLNNFTSRFGIVLPLQR